MSGRYEVASRLILAMFAAGLVEWLVWLHVVRTFEKVHLL